MVKIGSLWKGYERTVFTVLHRIEIDGKVWIHYRDDRAVEYSCYEEAFVTRFKECIK